MIGSRRSDGERIRMWWREGRHSNKDTRTHSDLNNEQPIREDKEEYLLHWVHVGSALYLHSHWLIEVPEGQDQSSKSCALMKRLLMNSFRPEPTNTRK